MRFKVLALAILFMFGLSAPGTSAATVTHHYDLATGLDIAGEGTAMIWSICGPGWDGEDAIEEGDGLWFPVQTSCDAGREARGKNSAFDFGVQDFRSPDGAVHSQATISAEDDNFDSVFISGCVEDPNEELVFCPTFGEGCGSITIVPGFLFGGIDESGNDLSVGVFVYTAHLNADTLEVCLGSQGLVTTTFS